jgi:hypothetical protein
MRGGGTPRTSVRLPELSGVSCIIQQNGKVFFSGVMFGADSLIKPHGLVLIPIVVMALVILKLSVRE